MDLFQFYQNSTIYANLTVIRPPQCQNNTFVSHLLAEDPGKPIPSVVAILPVFDRYLPISSKLDYRYRCYRHPTPNMPKLTLCLPPACRRPKAPDSECNGNIASFGRISSNLINTLLFIYWFNRHLTPTMPKWTLCLPPARWGLRALDSQCSGNIAKFRLFSYYFPKTRPFTQI